MKAKFEVVGSFTFSSSNKFYFVGDIIEGTVTAGMVILRVAPNQEETIGKVAAVEFVDGFAKTGKSHLAIRVDLEDAAELTALQSADLSGEVLELRLTD